MNLLCVLARVPVPGVGKSRLRARLGDAAADRLAHAFAADVLDWTTLAADALLVAHEGSANLLPPVRHPVAHRLPQVAGDLGARITAAVDAGFAAGAERVVIVGTDCPTLPDRLIDQAFAGLCRAASTLVPALDGGWIALGVDRPLGTTLAGVTWSSPLTGEQTIRALRAGGRPPLVLPAWYDIDEPGDLDRVRRDPAASSRAPRTTRAVGEIVALTP